MAWRPSSVLPSFLLSSRSASRRRCHGCCRIVGRPVGGRREHRGERNHHRPTENVAGGAIGLALDEALPRRHADDLKLAPGEVYSLRAGFRDKNGSGAIASAMLNVTDAGCERIWPQESRQGSRNESWHERYQRTRRIDCWPTEGALMVSAKASACAVCASGSRNRRAVTAALPQAAVK